MLVHSQICSAPTTEAGFCDLTEEVRDAIAQANVQSGRVAIFSKKAECAVFLNENESGLRADLERTFSRLIPGSPLAGSTSVVVPVCDGKPWLGDWQRVMAFVADRSDGQFVIQISGA
ncbi:MAG TPA: YjbQ family protein [Actinomycetota bacterium]|nr:YjbQ family protein [Actinomycetota bacterium]